DEGEKRGDTVIIRLENKWFWIIPLAPEKISVGCVLDRDEFATSGKTPEQIFKELWLSSPPLRKRMESAQPLRPLQITGDFSYYNRRLVGRRLVRVGDAAGFMDPIFSAGVFLAMHSGRSAAQVILDALAAGNDGSPGLRAYEKRMFRSMQVYWHMVEGFYT